jgi:hypothetical protein
VNRENCTQTHIKLNDSINTYLIRGEKKREGCFIVKKKRQEKKKLIILLLYVSTYVCG